MDNERILKRLKLSKEQLEFMPIDLLIDLAKRLSLKDFIQLSKTSKEINGRLRSAENTIFRSYLNRDFGVDDLPHELDGKTAYYMLVKSPITQLRIGVWFRGDARKSVGIDIGVPDIIITTVNKEAPYHEAVRLAAEAIPQALQLTTTPLTDNDLFERGNLDQAFPGYVRIIYTPEDEKYRMTTRHPYSVMRFIYYKYIVSPPPRGVKIQVDYNTKRFEDGIWKENPYQ